MTHGRYTSLDASVLQRTAQATLDNSGERGPCQRYSAGTDPNRLFARRYHKSMSHKSKRTNISQVFKKRSHKIKRTKISKVNQKRSYKIKSTNTTQVYHKRSHKIKRTNISQVYNKNSLKIIRKRCSQDIMQNFFFKKIAVYVSYNHSYEQ